MPGGIFAPATLCTASYALEVGRGIMGKGRKGNVAQQLRKEIRKAEWLFESEVIGVRNSLRRSMLGILVIIFTASGCAFLMGGGTTTAQCSDTPRNAVETFLRGIAEFSIKLLKAVILPGMPIFGVFGDGDPERGKEIVRQLVRHPEVSMGDGDASSVFAFVSMDDTADEQVKRVVLEREEEVGEKFHTYQRAFLVRFDPRGNCIMAVRPADAAWSRVR